MHGHGLVFAESGELRLGLFLDPVFHRSFLENKDTNKRANSQKNFEVFRAGVFSSFQLSDMNYCCEIAILFLLLLKEVYIIEYY